MRLMFLFFMAIALGACDSKLNDCVTAESANWEKNWDELKDHVEARTEQERRNIKEFLKASDLLEIAKKEPFDKIDKIWKDYIVDHPIENCNDSCLAEWWEKYNVYVEKHYPKFEQSIDKLADLYSKLYDIDSQNGYRELLKERLQDADGWRERLQSVTYEEEIELIEAAYKEVLTRAQKARVLVDTKMEAISESLCATTS